MSATVPVYVKVEVVHFEWRRVSAVTIDEAIGIAHGMPDVLDVIDAQYDDPGCAVEPDPRT